MASKPEHETEVVVLAGLKEYGCPYPAGDERSTIWLEGFKAGMIHGGEIAAKAIRDEMRAGQ